jgi:hypothetical protein
VSSNQRGAPVRGTGEARGDAGPYFDQSRHHLNGMFKQVGMPEMVVPDLAAYEELAVPPKSQIKAMGIG